MMKWRTQWENNENLNLKISMLKEYESFFFDGKNVRLRSFFCGGGLMAYQPFMVI